MATSNVFSATKYYISHTDQGVLESTKTRYRKELLRKLLLADMTTSADNDPELTVVEFWNIKDVMLMLQRHGMIFQNSQYELAGTNF